ncbi:hypothetical protein BCR39DRAFT_35596 [Naematelia encephala]|uniref:Uncharacterized protein n=1 Tax=Naematelia encephala TaxID=71784 RepID=A0A1Y2BMB7_9TREE|nr:hypothetical protein BCR39DRAFT_35596 [Naematelia encephala]
MSAKAAGKLAASASMDISDHELDEEAMHEVERAMGISDHWIPPMKVKRRPKHKTTGGHRSKRHVSQILLHAVAGHLWLEDFRQHQLARKARLGALRAEDQRVAHISFEAVRASWWYPAEYRSTTTPWWIRCAVMPLVWPSALSSSSRPLYPAQPEAVFPTPYDPIVRKRTAESAFRFPQFEAPGDEVNERWARRNELRLGEEVVPFANYIEDVLCAYREIRYREEMQAAMSLSPAGESEQLMLSPPPRYLTPILARHLRPRCEGRTTMVSPDPPIYIQDIFSTRSPAPPPPYNACTDCETMVCDVLESPMASGVYQHVHVTGARAEALDEASYEDEVDTVEAFMAPVSASIRSLTSSRPTWSAPLTIGAYPPMASLLSPPALISATPIVSPRPVRATSQHVITQWDHALDLEDQPIFDVEAMFDQQEDQDEQEQEQREATAAVSSGLRAIGRWLGWRR